MDSYTRNMNYIRDILQISIKNDTFDKFLLMYPAYCVNSRDLNGIIKPNVYFTMEAIYEYYRLNPNSYIDDLMYKTLMNFSQNKHGISSVETILWIVQYQLSSEKFNTSPFKIDCQSILNELRKSLIQYKDIYAQSQSDYDIVPFWNTIENYDNDFKENYGHKML